jgi:hypothetical protein
MKPLFISVILTLMLCYVRGQGTFVYDQQSQTTQNTGGGDFPIGYEQPMGQSFTPTLTSVGFVQFEFLDFPNGSVGGNVYVNLWSGSLGTGTLLDSTTSVFVPNGAFGLLETFLFSSPLAVSPGTTYYFQPVLQSGDTTMTIIADNTYNYSGGTLYWNGSPNPNNADAWFREGIVVPEPSAGALVLLGAGAAFYFQRRRLFRHEL